MTGVQTCALPIYALRNALIPIITVSGIQLGYLAAFAVVVGLDADSQPGPTDAARAIQSMALTAWEAGVGSNWVSARRVSEVRGLLGFPGGAVDRPLSQSRRPDLRDHLQS